MTRLTSLLIVALALPVAGQDRGLFPRFAVTAGTSTGKFSTDVRIDQDDGHREGTLLRFERDLGLEQSKTLPRFGVQWRPFSRHESPEAYVRLAF
jgi:hypothetical protein